MTSSSQLAPTEFSAHPGQVLHRRAHAFLEGWRASQKPWRRDRAWPLYEELERLTATAKDQGAAEIAASALELAVYLCSFVDNDTAPNPAQHQALDRLVSRFAATVDKKDAARTQREESVADGTRQQIFYLCSEARELPGLAEQLRQQHCIVRSFDEPARLILALDEVSPDALFVHEAFVDDVHRLVAEVQGKRSAHRDPTLCLVLAEETDSARTLFAQRAGADAVVTERDPLALIAHLNKLLEQRQSLRYRVLIVEDDRGQALFCESILHHRGVTTTVCADATRIFEILADFKPDLVLLDLYLPGGNGLEIARGIRDRPAYAFLPIVFLSGEQDIDQRFEAIRAGADDFITKPVKPRHLVTTVESRIKRARELLVGQAESHALQHAYAQLKQRVDERTQELSARNAELEIAYAKLKSAQEQAIQSEKLASIGQLAAGVAHEINNPIGYVSSNLNTLQSYVSQLLGAIDACAVAFAPTNDRAAAAVVEEIRRRFDIDFLAVDVPQLLAESRAGIDRVRKIIRDLKDFSRRDRSDSWVRTDVHAGLESTLNIVLNQLKYKAQIIKTFAELPLIECLPSELNQVFLNILMNAGQAIKERGVITVSTGRSADRVWIAIGDDGEGIPEDVLPNIFDPFFTTKPVGTGTGLGLSISYAIVAKLHGSIQVTSVPGQGTLMRIELPIEQPH